MPGKYDGVIKQRGLPKLPAELTEGGANRQYEIAKVKETIEDRTPAALVQLYAKVRKESDEIDERAHEAHLKVEAVGQLLVEVYEGEGITNLNVMGVGSVRSQVSVHTVIKDKAAFQQWCRENQFDDQMVLPWATANAIVKERLLSGEETPGTDVYFKTAPVLTREK